MRLRSWMLALAFVPALFGKVTFVDKARVDEHEEITRIIGEKVLELDDRLRFIEEYLGLESQKTLKRTARGSASEELVWQPDQEALEWRESP